METTVAKEDKKDKWHRNYHAEVHRDRILAKGVNDVARKDEDFESCMKSETCTSKLKYLHAIFYTFLAGLTSAAVTFVIEVVVAMVYLANLLSQVSALVLSMFNHVWQCSPIILESE